MTDLAAFAGETIRHGDAAYDEARTIFNAMIDRRPQLIVRCTGPEDIALAIGYARHEGLPLSVRAAGHSVAGMCLCDGVVIDVGGLKDVVVDPERKTARVGAGVTWSEFDRATQEHGLATTGGRVSTTGVAGLTLGGGSGWLERSYGLSCDNVLAFELVTANGEQVRASADENPELFWALRGGGGNFGVVTAFEFRLHEVGPTLLAGLAAYDPADGPELIRAFRDFHRSGNEAAGLGVGFLTAPPEPFIPEEWQGRMIAAIVGCWNGPVDEGERALRPLLETREAIVDLFGPMPYADFQCMIDDPPGLRNYWTAEYLSELPDEAVDAFCAYSGRMPLGYSQSLLLPWGGEVARLAGDSTPLAKRDAAWVVHPFVLWDDAARDAELTGWGRSVRDVFAPWATGGTYLNFVGEEGEERIRAAFGPAFDRLAQVKAAWDPENVFQGNQNILPAAAGARA
jgi:FAD/FMN-containing dehydrogenase